MPIYQRCDESVKNLADEILNKFESHHPVRDAHVAIDFVFAYPSEDENGVPQGDALTKNGVKCLGLCRVVPAKDRVLGRGDAEISIDGDWWEDASDEEREALLDHELHHISVVTKHGRVVTDDSNRPKLRLRKHDIEVGWFDIIAARHGIYSQERQQAKVMFDARGQVYWPQILGAGDGTLPNVTLKFNDKEIPMPKSLFVAGGVR